MTRQEAQQSFLEVSAAPHAGHRWEESKRLPPLPSIFTLQRYYRGKGFFYSPLQTLQDVQQSSKVTMNHLFARNLARWQFLNHLTRRATSSIPTHRSKRRRDGCTHHLPHPSALLPPKGTEQSQFHKWAFLLPNTQTLCSDLPQQLLWTLDSEASIVPRESEQQPGEVQEWQNYEHPYQINI